MKKLILILCLVFCSSLVIAQPMISIIDGQKILRDKVRTLEGGRDTLVDVPITENFAPTGHKVPVAPTKSLNELIDDVSLSISELSTPDYINPVSLSQINREIDPYGYKTPEVAAQLPRTALFTLIRFVFGIRMLSQPSAWSHEELLQLYTTLYHLPRSFVKHCNALQRVGIAFGQKNILGYMYWSQPKQIYIAQSAFNYRVFPDTVVHEMAHSFTARTPGFETTWRDSLYSKTKHDVYISNEKFPTAYAASSVREDIAESISCYVMQGARLKSTSPSRYEYLKNNVFGGREYRR